MIEKLYQFFLTAHDLTSIDSCFLATEEEVIMCIGKRIRINANTYCKIEKETIALISEDEAVIKVFKEFEDDCDSRIFGINPVTEPSV